ncbi:SphA family protein [Hydrogenophilus thermoluteolus]|uniref:Meta-pathway phenol degradation-like protein n=1 Tax=Hydrogenophilus thermoluteolus TaxID=297 RepID=A0A2Z6DV56_HYDTE|nr:transporter [Hydrogenophilus thermoluteolus]BBD76314.1 meta-pathway phenol degradation-like protein [Hydrogenophilus thermoluteolus]
MRKASKLAFAVSCMTMAMSGIAHAGGHYVPGVEGIQAASVPPPGKYYLGYLVNYNIDKIDGAPGQNDGTVTALANRFVWITNQKFLGADYGLEAIVPLQSTSFTFNGIGYSGSSRGLGDVFLGPVVLGWHGSNWDSVFALGLWFDNGDFSATNPSSVGKGYKSTMWTLGGTVYPDSAKTWSISALARYEQNGKQDQTGITPGDGLSIEWGIGKQIGGGKQLGLVGYYQKQTTKDSGPGALPVKPSKSAIGVQFDYPLMEHGVILKFAGYHEVSSNSDAKGNLFRVTLIKVF